MNTNPRRLGKYELLEQLGHGGVAEVWKAFDTQLQRFVAIKLLHPNLRDNPNFTERFKREAQLIASLRHPNIVNIHDFEVYTPSQSDKDLTSVAYMVMDYIEGQTLADYIRNTSSTGQIPSPIEIVNLFTSISLAIDYAHQKGMIHRDIKPANILLDARNTSRNPMGEPILTDFGVARLLSASSNTITGTQLGTPLYLSPEQARGYPGNERSDLYSLGVILYEMLTGVTPFRGDTVDEVISQQANATPPAPALINPNIPPSLTLVIMRSIAKDPAARFPSASSMTAAIAESLNLPVPEILGQPSYPQDSADMPTHLSQPSFSSSLASPASADSSSSRDSADMPTHLSHPGFSSFPSSPAAAASSSPSSFSSQTPSSTGGQPAQSGPVSQPGQATPNFTPVMVYSHPSASQAQPATSPAPPQLPSRQPGPASPPPARPARRRGFYIALASLLLLVLIGASGTVYLLGLHPSAPPTPSVIGHAFFVSSGQLNTGTAQGIADQLEIDLQYVPDPQPGKSYYAWLLADRHPESNPDLTGPRPIKPPILVTNNLPVHNGRVHFLFSGDAQHNNLISTTSRLLITEEPNGSNPATPSLDRSTWRYYAEIPQTQITGDVPGFSALVHIRHLFYNETNLKVLGLPGGLDIWLYRNVEKLVEFSASARDDWNGANTTPNDMQLMSDHFIRILDYLDGSTNTHVDLPPGTPLLTDPLGSKVSLLTVDSARQIPANLAIDPPGYVDHIQLHVGQVAKASDITPQTRQLTVRIIDSVNRAKIWLMNVRNDALQLHKIANDPAQMKQASTGALLDDMLAQATYAYIGQLDPVTNQVKGGVLQAHYDIQQLATFDVSTNLPQSL